MFIVLTLPRLLTDIPVHVYSAAGGMPNIFSKRFSYSVRMVDVSVNVLLYVIIEIITVFLM